MSTSPLSSGAPDQELVEYARRRVARAHHRDPRSARHRQTASCAKGRSRSSRASPGPGSTSATFPPGTLTGSRCGRATSNASWPTGSTELAVPIYRNSEVTGFAQDETGVDSRTIGQARRCGRTIWSAATAAAAVVRKAAGIDFAGSRSDARQPHGRGRDGRRAGVGPASRRARLPRPRARRRAGGCWSS